ncbi:hypothetical protein R1sor_025949 [Riccia sorocarpa]|uniref:Trichome birefringence-like N-terminal domain-containing protein n=1 Tax=Riccia sorocarpa TaxID=122646 RepID=A0ABD3GDQ1_9MARC
MTVYNDENSPKKAAPAHGHKWPEQRRRDDSKNKICAWILVVLLPFLLVKLVFFYTSPFLLFSPAERNQAELTTELEFASPAFIPSRDEEIVAGSKKSPTSELISDSGTDSSVQYETESKTPVLVVPPTHQEVDESEAVEAVGLSPQAQQPSGEEELSEQPSKQEEQQEEKEQVDSPSELTPMEPVDEDSPQDNGKKDDEKWEAPPEQEKAADDKRQPEEPVDEDSPQDNEKKDAEKWEAPPKQEDTISSNASALAPAESKGCDLYDGEWVYDPEGPLYTNRSCFLIQSYQNCMLNGRSDSAYLHWKWKPRHCDLPRFDARRFMEIFRGKSIGFVGDSLSRNQMQSLLCMLSQLEIPEKLYQSPDDKSVRWLFTTYNVTLGTVWSPYLLKAVEVEEVKEFIEQYNLYTDTLDDGWTSVMNDFDVMVLSIGQWFFKSAVFIQNDEIIGCHYCPGRNLTEVGFAFAFRAAVRQVLEKVARDYRGFTIMSTFALDHFENGSWSNGGSCTREQPLKEGEKVLDGINYEMHQVVIEEYDSIVERRRRNRKRVEFGLLDVTVLSLLRADGHPGPWRIYNPYDGVAPGAHVKNDCLHWCLPGPVDTWNQLLLEILSNQKN